MNICPKCGSTQIQNNLLGFCQSCGHPLASAVAVQWPTGDSMPWENIEKLGFFTALYRTATQILFTPSVFFANTGRTYHAWLYGLVIGSLGLIAGFMSLYFLPSLATENLSLYGLNPKNYSAAALISAPLIISTNCLFTAVYCQIMLTLTGVKKNSLWATFRISCYAQTASLFGVIPAVGNIVAPCWFIYLMITGISRTHGIGRIRAFFIITLPVIVIILFLSFFMAALVFLGIVADGFFKEILTNFRYY